MSVEVEGADGGVGRPGLESCTEEGGLGTRARPGRGLLVCMCERGRVCGCLHPRYAHIDMSAHNTHTHTHTPSPSLLFLSLPLAFPSLSLSFAPPSVRLSHPL